MLLVATIVIAASGGIAVVVSSAGSDLDAARDLLDDDTSFTTASGAGTALNRVSIHLQDAGQECGDGPECDRLFTAAAVARVSAVGLLSCRRPQIFELRNAFRTYLDELDAGGAPRPPAPPGCG